MIELTQHFTAKCHHINTESQRMTADYQHTIADAALSTKMLTVSMLLLIVFTSQVNVSIVLLIFFTSQVNISI